MSALSTRAEPAPDAMVQSHADEQAVSPSRQSTPSTPPINGPSQTLARAPPPTPPPFIGLDLAERNLIKRKYEKAMYEYMYQYGTVSTTEICGPCDRTNAPCIRFPGMRKCALCFRGHDVCEMWDETVANIGRRRAHPKNQKRDQKKDNKALYLMVKGS